MCFNKGFKEASNPEMTVPEQPQENLVLYKEPRKAQQRKMGKLDANRSTQPDATEKQ